MKQSDISMAEYLKHMNDPKLIEAMTNKDNHQNYRVQILRTIGVSVKIPDAEIKPIIELEAELNIINKDVVQLVDNYLSLLLASDYDKDLLTLALSNLKKTITG